MTIRRTTQSLPAVRYGRHVEFDPDQRETDAYDEETEAWAVETFDDIIHADDGEADGKSIEEEAAEVVTELDHPR